MATRTWTTLEEPAEARQARQLACSQKPDEVDFWNRSDLVYVGDLGWTKSPNFVGYEFITEISRRGETGFTYKYGLLGMVNTETIGQTMICEVRDQETDPSGFDMLIGNEWQPGPLKAWLDTLAPEVQDVARSRYRDLVSWVRENI
jgi:hypothetical protein